MLLMIAVDVDEECLLYDDDDYDDADGVPRSCSIQNVLLVVVNPTTSCLTHTAILNMFFVVICFVTILYDGSSTL